MGSECSLCNRCEIIHEEKGNELNNSKIKIKLLGSMSENNILYYQNYIPEIIFLQMKIKKFLKKLKDNTNPKEAFYNKIDKNTNDLSNDDLKIIDNNTNNLIYEREEDKRKIIPKTKLSTLKTFIKKKEYAF